MDRPLLTPTTWDRTVTTQSARSEVFPTRVRWGLLRRTATGFTTWLGMWMSGVGIGMGRRMLEEPTPAAPRQAPTVCYGAAPGTTTPTTAGRHTATTSTRRSATTS